PNDGVGRLRVRSGKVQGVVKTERPQRALLLQPLQIAESALRVHHHRECARIRSNDKIPPESTLQGEVRYAEGPVLVDEVPSPQIVRTLADSPRNTSSTCVRQLATDGGAIRLSQERGGVGLHDERRHEVLEHATTPGDEGRL